MIKSANNKIKKVFIILIFMCATLIFFYNTDKVNAASKAKFTKQTVDMSNTYGNVKANVYYQKIKFKGSSKAVKKINKAIEKDCNKFLNSSNVDCINNYAKESAVFFDEKIDIYYCAKASVKYNKKGIVSIKITIDWYAGGVENISVYGLNYNLKTGEKLRLKDICKGSSNSIKNKIYKKVEKAVKLRKESPEALNVVQNKKIKEYQFYLRKNKAVMVTFEPYELGSGGWYREFKI